MTTLTVQEEFEVDCSALLRVLTRFTLKELKDIVAVKFTTTTWDRIVEELAEGRQALTSKTVAAVLLKTLRATNLVPSRLKTVLSLVNLADIRQHGTRRVWHSYEMSGAGNNSIIGRIRLTNQITQKCEDQVITVKVFLSYGDQFYWISVEELKPKRQKKKKRAKGAESIPPRDQYKPAIFFAAAMGEPFFFSCCRSVKPEILQSITEALGYDKYKALPFSDKNVFEILKSLKMRDGQCGGKATVTAPTYTQGLPEATSMGFDFSGTKAKTEYVNEVFGEEPPVVSSVTFQAREKVPGLAIDVDLPVEMTIRSGNVWETVKTLLVETDVIKFPPPPYYQQAMLSGKNTLKLRRRQPQDN